MSIKKFFKFDIFWQNIFQMQDVTATYRNGSTAQLANIYIRGTQIKFMILPEMLKNAPMLKVN